MSLRVLNVYAGNLYGGIERFLVSVAENAAAAPGMTSDFALCFHGRLWDELAAARATVHDLGPVRRSRPWTGWRARRKLKAILAAGGYDVVVCHAFWPHAIFAPAVRAMGVPLVFWNHDSPEITKSLDAAAGKYPPDLAITNSQFTRPAVEQLFPGVEVIVRYYAVAFPPADAASPEERIVVRKELDTPENAVVIAIVARMQSWKGHPLLLDGLAKVRAGRRWVCWVVGGAQRPEEHAYVDGLIEQARRLGIEGSVRFLGQRSDVARLLRAADIHCQPNAGPEPFGIAFVEALYAGLAVVTTAIGAGPEILENGVGQIVPPADPDALADVLTRLIDDPAERRRVSESGPSRARELCSPEVVLPSMESILRRVAVLRKT